MSSHGPMIFDIALSGNRYLRPGENYQFSLKINHLILNYVHVTEINTIQILVKIFSSLLEHPWEYESDRWGEMIRCVLMEGIGVNPDLAQNCVNALKNLKMISVSMLAHDSDERRNFIRLVLQQVGVDEDSPLQASSLLVRFLKTGAQTIK